MYSVITSSTRSTPSNFRYLMKMDVGTLQDITSFIEKCRNEPEFDRQLKILIIINSMLPYTKQLHIPSFLTDDYIDRALHEIEKALKSKY